MIRKTLSKMYIITTFAMFGLFLQPNVFANQLPPTEVGGLSLI